MPPSRGARVYRRDLQERPRFLRLDRRRSQTRRACKLPEISQRSPAYTNSDLQGALGAASIRTGQRTYSKASMRQWLNMNSSPVNKAQDISTSAARRESFTPAIFS